MTGYEELFDSQIQTSLKEKLEKLFAYECAACIMPPKIEKNEIVEKIKIHNQVVPVRAEWEQTQVGLLPRKIEIDFSFIKEISISGIKDDEMSLIIQLPRIVEGKVIESAEEAFNLVLGEELAKEVMSAMVAGTALWNNQVRVIKIKL